MAFHDLTPAGAEGLLRRDFGSVLAGVSANPAASVAAAGRVVRYIGDDVALVRAADGSLVREVSSVPLRVSRGAGGKRPVSLALRRSGAGFAAVNPLHGVSISERLGGGVALGSPSIRLIAQGVDARAQLVGASSVFYPGVGPDEDASVAPTLAGVELSTVLRSRLSPQEISYRLVLPAGAVLRSSGGGAVIADGVTEVHVLSPTARDAQGQEVPVQMNVAGDRLVLHIAHRHRDVAYPLLVDPVVTVNHCCGEWKFEGAEWEESPNKPSESEWHVEPGDIEALTGTHNNYYAENLFWNDEWQKHHGWEDTRQEFVGVSYQPYENEPSLTSAYLGGMCDKWTSVGFGAPPSTLVFPSSEYELPPKSYCSPNGFGMGLETSGQYNFTSPAHLSVAAILITARSETARKHHRRKGPRHREVLGSTNPGEPSQFRVCEGDPVECATGNETETQTDLSIPGLGVPLALTRTYNSQAAVTQSSHGPFGYGWSASFSDHLTISTITETTTVEQANGSTVVFKGNPRAPGELTAPPWAQAKLVVQSDGSFIYTLPSQLTFHFSESGLLLSESDRNGNVTTVGHSGERITSVSDPSGRKVTFKYNAEGEVESVEDPMKHVVKYVYEGGNLKSVTQPGEASLRWQFKYDTSHELTEMIDGRSGKTTNEYNSSHQVISQTDPMSRVLKFEYEEIKSKAVGDYALPALIQESSAEEAQEEVGTEEISGEVVTPAPEIVTKVTHVGTGAVTLEHFNGEDKLEYITKAYGTSIASTEEFTYNAGAIASISDGNKHITKYEYDSEGNRIKQVDPNENITKWEYDKTHDVTSVTTPGGETTTIKREAHGNPESISRPAPGEKTQTTKYKYKANGELESVTDPLERTWKYEYDTHGDPTSETDPEGDKRTWGYNEDSQETSTVSPRGHVKSGEEAKYTTKIERDSQGRPLTVTDPLTHKTKYTYDGNGNLETLTDANSNITKYTYDADNERTKVEEPNKTITETGYDSAGKVTSQTDGSKNTTKYQRNKLEQVVEVVDPKGRKTIREYDPAGNLKALTDAAKRTATYTYDPANRLKEVSYSDGKTHAVENEYNRDGKVTVMKDGSGATKYTYDQLDRLREVENGHKEVIKYEYDLANQQTKITYPNTKAVTRAYDKAGRLEKITDWSEHTTKAAYNADSELITTTFPSETKNEDKYTYDEADRLTEVKMLKSAETLASLLYTRDSDGQVKTVTSKGLPGEEKPAYEYDANNRLKKGGTTAYEYDAADNPTKQGTSTYKYDSADELETGPSLTYAYDELGERAKTNPTSGPATTDGYDQAGSLISVERPKEGEVSEIKDTYAYDGNNLRASQTISGTTTYLAWDVSQGLPLLLADGTNSYIYGPEGLPIEQINNTTGTVLYLHHDQQGSTRLLTSSTGAKEASFTYDSYGNQTGHSGTATTPLGYDGQYTSSDTGLIYLRARVYDPATAQFLSRDPMASLTRQPYAYGADNPVNLGDPLGYEALPLPIEGPAGLTLCADPITAVICVGAGGYAIKGEAESLYNAFAGEEAGNDEGESELRARQAAERVPCGDPTQPPGEGWEWKGKGPVGSSEGAWVNPETEETLHPDLDHPEPQGPHYDYTAPDGSKFRIYPDGRIEPNP